MRKPQAPLIRWEVSHGWPQARTLVLVLHGLDSSPITVQDLAAEVLQQDADAHVLIPALPFQLHRAFDFQALAHELLVHLDAELELESYAAIRIIGHSAGGVLAQVVYLLACGEGDHALGRVPLSRLRLILLAPITRGWEITHHLPLGHKLAWSLGTKLSPCLTAFHLLRGRRGDQARPWVMQLQRGRPLLVWLRLSWLELEARPEVVQLLGSVDELISWRDMVDSAIGEDFIYFEVPNSNHASIVELQDGVHSEARRAVFRASLGTLDELRASPYSVRPWDVDPPRPDPRVKRVVFVIHGIRDEGHWTQKVGSRARRVHAAQRAGEVGDPGSSARDEVAVVTGSYGFFSMLQFLLPGERHKKVQWLVDQYTDAKRRYPNAEFSYVGHSHGTYLAAHAMHRYPQLCFERVAFAGSVVSRYFDWDALQQRGQVQHVINFTASEDFVVGLIPQLADVFPHTWLAGVDLGGAGVYRFEASQVVQSVGHRIGGHSSAIAEDNWEALARFAVLPEIEVPSSNTPNYAPERHPLLERFGKPLCIGTWLIGLYVLLVLLPRLAWNHPALLWLWPVIPCVLSLLWIASRQGQRAASTFAERQHLKQQCSEELNTLARGLVLWFVLAVPILVWGIEVESTASEMGRTLSVGVYFALIYAVLTKV